MQLRSLSTRFLLAVVCMSASGVLLAHTTASVAASRHRHEYAPRTARTREPAVHYTSKVNTAKQLFSTLVWSDDFSGAAGSEPNPRKWDLMTGSADFGDGGLQYYTGRPSNVSLDGQGHLAIIARHEYYNGGDGPARDYTSARMQTLGLFSTTYGRLEARIKLPAGQGLWPAFWAMGTDHNTTAHWPECGEIDVMESLGGDPFTLYGSVHGPQLDGDPNGYGLTTPKQSSVSLAAAFHTYGVDWSPGRIVFTFDGVPYSTLTRASLSAGQEWVFDNHAFYLLLNLGVGGSWPGSPTVATSFPATMLVDWVKVYSAG
jgi:beta-glucanase (GH16 family)